jgi:hypothetical protein
MVCLHNKYVDVMFSRNIMSECELLQLFYDIIVVLYNFDFAKRHFFKLYFSNKDLDVTKISNMLHHYLIQFNQKSCLTSQTNQLA